MSMALLVGFIVALPMNWWLVARHLKHGMTTVRPATAATPETKAAGSTKAAASSKSTPAVPRIALLGMMNFSLAAFVGGLALAAWIATVR